MKKIISTFIFFIIVTFLNAQNNWRLQNTIQVKTDFFTTDDQGNIYVVVGSEIRKYNKEGKKLYTYSNMNLGDIYSVDASNILRILVYYKNFLQVVFLDNTLSQTVAPINLSNLGYQQVSLVCTSYNSALWLYNNQNMELRRLGQNLELTQQTGNLTQLLNIDLYPIGMLEQDNQLYLNNPETGILMFDVYGTYYKTIPVKNVKQFQPAGDWVYYINSNKLLAMNTKTMQEEEYLLPEGEYLAFRLEMDRLYLQTADAIELFVANKQ